MATGAGGDFDFKDGDRLPWLESAESDVPERAPVGRLILAVLIGLMVVGGAVFGIWWFQQHRTADGPEGSGELIAAQEGDYKVKPDDPGGMTVDGEGGTVFRTSEGEGPSNGSIDVRAVPEAPVEGRRAGATRPTQGSARAAAEVPASGGLLHAAPPARPGAVARVAPGSQASGGALVQLGSFPSAAAATAAWNQMSKRFAYIGALGHAVVQAEVNGRTVHRLRVNAGSAGQATDLCARLKVAGEACFVARD